MKQVIFSITLMLMSASIFAQAPQAFNYQGVARDLSGHIIPNKNIGLQIVILQGSNTGIEVYKETQNITTTGLGLFNLKIGKGNSVNGVFEEIDWEIDNHFLQIEMDENGGSNYQIIGTSELLSVPYALTAGNGSKWNENAFGINNTYKKTNIGILEPTNNHYFSLNIRGNKTDVDGVVDLVGYYNLTNNTPIWHNSLSTSEAMTFTETGVGTHLYLEKGGNIGIGTNNPKANLEIAGNSNDDILGLPGDWNLRYDKGNTSASQGGFDISDPNSENLTFYKFEGDQTTDPVTAIQFSNEKTLFGISKGAGNFSFPKPILVANDNGNIGVGTFDPISKLQVTNGDIFIENINSGVIMKSPNGQCWRMTVNNSGQPEVKPINCSTLAENKAIPVYNQAYQENFEEDKINDIKNNAQNAYVLLDPFQDNINEHVVEIKLNNNQVGAYISIGTGEDWRSDFAAMQPFLVTTVWGQWAGEYFVNSTTTGIVDIMKSRIDSIAHWGYDWVEFDNMDWVFDDIYRETYEFEVTEAEGIAYYQELCDYVHSKGMKCMAKNITQSSSDFDGVLYESYDNEKNWWDQSGAQSFLDAGKLVIVNHYNETNCGQVYSDYKGIYNNNLSFICEDANLEKYVHFNE